VDKKIVILRWLEAGVEISQQLGLKDSASRSGLGESAMKAYRWVMTLLMLAVMSLPAAAQQRLIVRDKLGLAGLNSTCVLLNCQVSMSLGDPLGQVFVVTSTSPLNLTTLLTLLENQLGIVDVEVDQQLSVIEPAAGPIPESLIDETPLPYYGASVWDGYETQPAAQIVRVLQAQQAFHVTGAGIVAMIDTGVDTQHPALVPVLVPGYNFINNTPNGDETGTLDHSSAALLDGGGAPTYLSGTTIAVVSPQLAALLNQPADSDFGHGTMTAGIVHLVAPTAKIMPLKAFSSDGTGYLSNIIRATYYAVQHNSRVISMSFSFTSSSQEMTSAIQYANSKNVICVAAAGNNGADEVVYPAGIPGVMAVASTSDYDTRSSFSNYGPDIWVAAPGEGIMTTYPYGTYSAGWGTSFSTPFVSGTAALLVQISPNVNQQSAAAAIAHAVPLNSGMGNGELDVYQAVDAWSDLQPAQ
jgi:subtilisin family serine protease